VQQLNKKEVGGTGYTCIPLVWGSSSDSQVYWYSKRVERLVVAVDDDDNDGDAD
jgi:hypothetical protein